jgi:hypothetical protein
MTQLLTDLEDVKNRLTNLETQINQQISEGKEELGEGEATTRQQIISDYVAIRMTVTALRGYQGALVLAGLLPKDVAKQLLEIEIMTARVAQGIRIMQMAMTAFEAGAGPMGWALLALSGGSFAASIVWGSKLSGG